MGSDIEILEILPVRMDGVPGLGDLEGYAKALKKSSPVMACSVSSNFSMGGR